MEFTTATFGLSSPGPRTLADLRDAGRRGANRGSRTGEPAFPARRGAARGAAAESTGLFERYSVLI